MVLPVVVVVVVVPYRLLSVVVEVVQYRWLSVVVEVIPYHLILVVLGVVPYLLHESLSAHPPLYSRPFALAMACSFPRFAAWRPPDSGALSCGSSL